MTYQPVIPGGGNVGWTFLKATRAAQQAAFDGSASVVRDADYFAAKIGSVTSAEDLVADRRLLGVALGAFGLDDDIGNRFYIRKVLEEGTLDEGAFANRLADKRYFALARAFSFDLAPPNTVLSDFAEPILDAYRSSRFEVAVGEQDEGLRLALGTGRDLAELADRGLGARAAWFTVMGTPPLRAVFEGAFGLPPETAAIDIDRQLELFAERAGRLFGAAHPADFADPERQDALLRRFLLGRDLAAGAATTAPGGVALSLLRMQAPLI